jgi:hypothetical protein
MQRQPESLIMAQERLRLQTLHPVIAPPRDFGCNAGGDEVLSCGHARIGRVSEEKIRITATGLRSGSRMTRLPGRLRVMSLALNSLRSLCVNAQSVKTVISKAPIGKR